MRLTAAFRGMQPAENTVILPRILVEILDVDRLHSTDDLDQLSCLLIDNVAYHNVLLTSTLIRTPEPVELVHDTDRNLQIRYIRIPTCLIVPPLSSTTCEPSHPTSLSLLKVHVTEEDVDIVKRQVGSSVVFEYFAQLPPLADSSLLQVVNDSSSSVRVHFAEIHVIHVYESTPASTPSCQSN